MPSQTLEQTLAEEFPEWRFTGAAGGDGNIEPSGAAGDGGGGGGCFIGTVGNSP